MVGVRREEPIRVSCTTVDTYVQIWVLSRSSWISPNLLEIKLGRREIFKIELELEVVLRLGSNEQILSGAQKFEQEISIARGHSICSIS